MPLSSFIRTHARALSVISICTVLVTFGSVWASRQEAGAPTHYRSAGFSAIALVNPDKGVMTPEATITVNSLSDLVNGGDGLCTLREAVTAANNSAASGAAAGECAAGSSSGDDLIDFDPALSGQTITLTGVELLINKNLTIQGPGASGLTVSGNNSSRVFNIQSGKTVTINDLTIFLGKVTGVNNGGGVLNNGTLTLANCKVADNKTDSSGGGIYSTGTLTVTDSTVSGNNASGDGGGIYNRNGTLTVTNSTFSANSAIGSGGGGIYNFASPATLTNSTLSGNLSDTGGGGIYNLQGSFTCTNDTLSSNNAVSNGGGLDNNGGGGIYNVLGTVILRNTIVAGNPGPNSTTDDIKGTSVDPSSSFNLIGTGGSGGLTNGVNNNQVDVPNARLEQLDNNGGPTQTRRLLAGSPALDAGSNAFITNPPFPGPFTDQRGAGFSRIVDGADADTTDTVDIGAFEAQVSVEAITDKSTQEDTPMQFTFNVGGASSITSVTATSDNAALIPNNPANIAVSGSGSTRTLTINPLANKFGFAIITVTVNGTGGQSMKAIFSVAVSGVADMPSVTNATTNEDMQTTTGLVLSINPADGGEITFFKISGITNGTLFKNNGTTQINNGDFITIAEGNAGLKFTPAANLSGLSTTFSFQVQSDLFENASLSSSATATITVNAVNDAPSFTKGANQTVNEDAAAQTVTNWATAILSGPADESGQALTFQVTGNTNAALFSAGPAISSTGTLTYTPAPNANGSATITINLKDDGGSLNGGVDTSASQTFTITVNPVNDAPSFTKGADQTVNNNAGAQSIANWATDLSKGPADESGQTLTFQVTGNTNPGLFVVTPLVSSSGSLTYQPRINGGGTATITINLRDNGGTANGGIDTSASQSFNITLIPVGGFINFSAATNDTTESSGSTTVTVKRTGDLTRAVTVNYSSSADNGLPCSTANGVATPKCDFTAALGTLSFAAGEDTKVVNILVSQDGFVEGPETFTVSLSNSTNFAALGSTSTSTTTIADDAAEPAPPANVIDEARNFVRQHYHDFLNREPDQSGWDFWTNQLTSCGSDVQCNEVKRINVSASFFLSIEFQQTGYLVERFYKVAYGDATGSSTFVNPHQLAVPIVRANEFLTDTQRMGRGVVVLAPGWEQALENNKQAYALEFIQTARFTAALPTTMTPAQFVTQLNQNAGGVLTLAEQQTAIDLFGGAGDTINQTARAQAVRMVAEDQDLYNAEFNRAFVLAEYFGYLRRNPNDAPETTVDYTGYDFWVTKLNQFNGNYINSEMVKAFLSSIEYRQRFGP